MTARTLARPYRRRGILAVASTAIVAATLAALPSGPAQAAAPTGPSLKWNISTLFQNRLTNKAYSNGAVKDGSNMYWTNGAGTRNESSGVTSISYQGTVVASRNRLFDSSSGYTLSISDPTVTIDEEGQGTVSAVVGSVLLKNGAATTTRKDPKRVDMVSFEATGANWLRSGGLDRLKATPDWSTQSFDPEFLAQIVGEYGPNDFKESGLNNWFNDPAPLAFTATITSPTPTEPTPTPTVPTPTTTTPTTTPTTEPTAAPPAVTFKRSTVNGELVVDVTGKHFTGVTRANDDGVWVGVVPSSTDLETIEPEDAYPYGLAHVPAAQINTTTGGFTTRVTIRRANLRLDTEYSLVTWQATEHSNTSQDTMTPLIYVTSAPVTEDPDEEPTPGDTTIVLNGAITPPYIVVTPTRYGTKAVATVNVPDVDTGTVQLTVDGRTKMTAPVRNGAARFTLGTPAVGAHQLRATYVEAASTPVWFIKGSGTNVLLVTKATPKVTVKVTKRPTTTKKGKSVVTVAGVAGMTKARGRILLTLTSAKGKKVKVVGWAKNGQAKVNLPKVKKGTWKITVRYYGSNQYTTALTGTSPKVKVTK